MLNYVICCELYFYGERRWLPWKNLVVVAARIFETGANFLFGPTNPATVTGFMDGVLLNSFVRFLLQSFVTEHQMQVTLWLLRYPTGEGAAIIGWDFARYAAPTNDLVVFDTRTGRKLGIDIVT